MTLVRALALCASLALLQCGGAFAADNESAPPNVVIILADDLGRADIGAYGATRIRTPAIDSLARNGTLFTQAYASANVCSPSRAGLLTGRYAIRSGLAWKVLSARDERALPPSEETLGELARRAGLNTLYVGKWHLGALPAHGPTEHGFEHFFGVPHSNDMPDFALYEDAVRIEQPVDQRRLTGRYTQAAVEFIQRQGKRPFLLLVAHTFPHIPLHASEHFHGRSDAGLYGDTVEELDASTGEILAALERSGVRRNTLVIITSDNGPFFEGSTGGLRGGKGTSWEGAYRVPFIVSWPAVARSHRRSAALTMNTDVLPTVAEALGLQPAAAALDGQSLLPVLRGKADALHEILYLFNNEEIVAIRTPDWKLVTHAWYQSSLGAFEKFDQLPGFDAPYELLFDARGMDSEYYSVADRHPEVMAELKTRLRAAREQFAPLRTHPPDVTYPE